MEMRAVSTELQQMQSFFNSCETLSYEYRMKQLRALKEAIVSYENEIFDALHSDLKKGAEEAYATETGLVISEISYAEKRLKKWMKPTRLKTNLLNFPSSSRLYRDPYGVVLIIGSWNYPFQLLINPLVGAIAAGNCAVLKPSEVAPASSSVIAKLIKNTFDSKYIRVYEGEGSEVVPSLMDNFRFDYIFYTGSAGVGKMIYEAAAKKLCPITLELGGKSPAIVENNADLKTAAKRIVIGKFLNAGQTCVAPDYVLVQNDSKDKLLNEINNSIENFFGKDPKGSADYGRIINEKRFDTLMQYLPASGESNGIRHNKSELYFAPTVLADADTNDKVMQEEIFGPILPVIGYDQKEDALGIVKKYEKPLSFYLFTKNKTNEKWWMKNVSFGGGCINNTLWHLSNPNLPFGGVGGSGIGAYHGRYSFETFSHPKPVMSTPTWFDPKMKYPPFKGKLNMFKRFIK